MVEAIFKNADVVFEIVFWWLIITIFVVVIIYPIFIREEDIKMKKEKEKDDFLCSRCGNPLKENTVCSECGDKKEKIKIIKKTIKKNPSSTGFFS